MEVYVGLYYNEFLCCGEVRLGLYSAYWIYQSASTHEYNSQVQIFPQEER